MRKNQLLSVLVAEALAAVYGTVIVRLKGNLACLSAVGAYSVIHLAGRALSTACLVLSAAIAASLRLVSKALLSVKLLLAGSENEFLSAVLADQSLVSVHVIPLFLLVLTHIDSIIILHQGQFVNPCLKIIVNNLLI